MIRTGGSLVQAAETYLAAGADFTGGIRVGSHGDINGDGHDDVLVAQGPGSKSIATVWDGVRIAESQPGIIPADLNPFQSISTFDVNFEGGNFISSWKMIIDPGP